jgi:hypothetical protein
VVGCTNQLYRALTLAVANMFHMAVYHKLWARNEPMAAWLCNSYCIEKRFGTYRYFNGSGDPDFLASDWPRLGPRVSRAQERQRFADVLDGRRIAGRHVLNVEDFPHLRAHNWTIPELMGALRAELVTVRCLLTNLWMNMALNAGLNLFDDRNYRVPGDDDGDDSSGDDAGDDGDDGDDGASVPVSQPEVDEPVVADGMAGGPRASIVPPLPNTSDDSDGDDDDAHSDDVIVPRVDSITLNLARLSARD